MSHEADSIGIETLLAQSGWVRALSRHLVYDREACDDVVQDAWVEALRRPPRQGSDIRAWFACVLGSFARQRRRGELRRAARERAAARDEEAGDGVDVVAQADLQQILIRAVLELEEPARTTVLERYVHGRSAASIARREGVPLSTVRNRLARALARLRTRLDRELGGRDRWSVALLPLAALGGRKSGGLSGASGKSLSLGLAVAGVLCAVVAWNAMTRSPAKEARLPSALATAAVASDVEGQVPSRAKAAVIDRRGSALEPEASSARGSANALAALEGTVIDAQDQPLAGVLVDVWTWAPGNETRTDAEGRFRLDGFEEGEIVEVVFRKHGFCPRLFVTQGVGVKDWRVELVDDTWVEGRVVGAEGELVPTALIRARRGPKHHPDVVISEIWEETTSDAEGRYRFHLEPDNYEISLRIPGRGAARVSNVVLFEKDHRTLDLELRRGATFRASVRDSRNGQPVARVHLQDESATQIGGTSDERGEIAIHELEPGSFTFVAQARGYARFWSEQCANPEGRFQPGERELEYQRNLGWLTFQVRLDAESVVIHAERAARVEGVVVDPENRPVAGASIAIVATGSRGGTPTGDTRYAVESDAEGRYAIEFPAGGETLMNLLAHDGEYGPARRWANAMSEPFHMQPGDVRRDLRLVLTRPGSIRGRVSDPQGEPVEGQELLALPTDGRGNLYYAPRAKTDAEGRFEMALVEPGEHVVEAVPLFPLEDARYDGRRKTVKLESGATVDGVQLVVERSPFETPPAAPAAPPREWNTKLQVSEAAPEFEMKALDGSTVRLSDLRGKIVLIDFWATWCRPCVEGLAVVEDATRGLRSRELHVIGISFDTSREMVERFLAKRPELDWKQLCDLQGFDSRVAKDYGVEAIPFVLLVDREGRITHRGLRGKALREAVREVVEKQR